MNVYRQYDQTIKDWSDSLSEWHGRLYCLAVCLHAFPLYEKFTQREGWGDTAAFVLTHQFLRASLAGGPPEPDALAECHSRVEEFTPHTEDYTDADFACDVGIMHLYALQCLEDYKSEWVYHVARYCYDLADAAAWRIIQPEGGTVTPELEQRAEQHSLIQDEMRRQAAIRKHLTAVPEGDIAAGETFLERQSFEDFLATVPHGPVPDTDRLPSDPK